MVPTSAKKLFSGEFKLKSNVLGKSDVWKSFGIVIDGEANELPFVGCKQCNHVMSVHVSTCVQP